MQKVVNGFDLCHNPTREKCRNKDDADKEFLVFHPLYDGFYFLKGFDILEEAISWCENENYDLWTSKLL